MEIEKDIQLLVGTITFEDLEGGYWALTDKEQNEKLLVLDIPQKLKKENLKIAAIGQVISNEMSIYMVGKAVKFHQYRILSPEKN